ncbi:type IV toxin-antitoxin system AbiEi family antitoxin domain-containing protein [Nocardia sp. NPDC051030]|uniref:type IV toxin-antitoxin system AbiEi family antitoxin domain-containing protein n=1 Tax=Nocardia sp. NPDC051030 TaxID=3155162 RepID=UPI00341C1D4F
MAGNDAAEPDTQDGWQALQELAGRHAGYFTTRQVLRTGCETRIRDGLRDGTVLRAGVGLLRLGDWPDGPLDEYAMWSAWFDGAAAVSHHSAAELHGLGRLRPRFVHMSARVGRFPLSPRLVVLRRTFARKDVESAGTFLVTTPLRTVLDLAEAGIGQSALDEIVADAVAIHRCARAEIRSASAALSPATAARLHRALTRA